MAKKVRISDILPKPVEIQLAPDAVLEVRQLDLTEMVRLFYIHSNSFLAMYAQGQMEKPNFDQILIAAPDLVADVIFAASTNLEDSTVEDIKQLSGALQLIAITEIWRLSVPDPKALVAALERLVSEAMKLNQELPSPASSVSNQLPKSRIPNADPAVVEREVAEASAQETSSSETSQNQSEN